MNEIKKIGLQNANDSQFKEVISYVCEWWVYFKPLIGRIILLSFFAGILGFFYAKRLRRFAKVNLNLNLNKSKTL